MRVLRRSSVRNVEFPRPPYWTAGVWQEVEGAPGEVGIEVGLDPLYRIILNRDDLDHLRAVIDADDEARVS